MEEKSLTLTQESEIKEKTKALKAEKTAESLFDSCFRHDCPEFCVNDNAGRNDPHCRLHKILDSVFSAKPIAARKILYDIHGRAVIFSDALENCR